MILLDTHAWIWWVDDPTRLSTPAREAVDAATGGEGVSISAISAWEVALLVAKGRLVLDREVSAWIDASAALPFVHFVPVDRRIAVSSVLLAEPLHPDPADRIIAATAISLGATLVTADQRLQQYAPVKTLW